MKSRQGYDMLFATNYLGHYLLTELMLPLLKKTVKSRIVFVSSTSHLQVDGRGLQTSGSSVPYAAQCGDYSSKFWITAYANSKLAQLYVIYNYKSTDSLSNYLSIFNLLFLSLHV